MIRSARAYVRGEAEGEALALSAPLSFWGGVDAETGRIRDPHHPQFGESVAGRILVMPLARGSSSSSSVLAEAIRLATAPAAIVLGAADPILTVGALVAASLYGRACPIVVCEIEGIATGDRLRVRAGAEGPAEVASAG
jgi:predicted aconitase with swiveling domain